MGTVTREWEWRFAASPEALWPIIAVGCTPHERHNWIKLGQDYGYEVQAVYCRSKVHFPIPPTPEEQ